VTAAPRPAPTSRARAALVPGVLLVVGLVAATVVVLLVSDAASPEAVRAPDAPADLCAVIGEDRIAEWVPEVELTRSHDANELNTESSCNADTSDGSAGDAYGHLDVRVYRYGSLAQSGEEQAIDSIEQACQGHEGTDLGPGDEGCALIDDEDQDGTGHVQVQVRSGADLVMISHYATTTSRSEVEQRVVAATEAVLAAL
jgi:hypothetical protein